jgi:hypothetical protein
VGWRGYGLRGEGGGCRLREPRVRGGGFIGAAEGASTCRPRAPRWRRQRATAGLRVDPESGSRSGKDPTGGSRLASRERGRDGSGLGRWAGREIGGAASWAGPRGEKEKGQLAGPCGRKGRRGVGAREGGPAG